MTTLPLLVGGLNLFDGDILLSSEQSSSLNPSQADGVEDTTTAQIRHARAVVKLTAKKWVDGVVPYVLSPEFSE